MLYTQTLRRYSCYAFAYFALLIGSRTPPLVHAEDVQQTPKAVPNTRTEIKNALEILKTRKPRLPVPSAAEMPPPVAGSAQAQQQSQWGSVTNGRARKFYLPDAWFQGEASLGSNDSKQLVDYKLKTQCFWVVSRGNNCHYCLGHQEHKLHLEGLDDNALGALDRDWSKLDSRTRKAVTLARKMTLEPDKMTDSDIENLKPEFDDNQIVELVYTIARFNATNRWTDSLGLPQDDRMRGEKISFESPTSKEWDTGSSLAAPPSELLSKSTPTWHEVQQQLSQVASHKPRVVLASESETRARLELSPEVVVNHWHQAIATLVQGTPAMVRNVDVMIADSELPTRLKMNLLWTTALHNRSWFSLAMAKQRLLANGATEKDLEMLSRKPVQDQKDPSAAVALAFAEKLTVTPHLISDADIAGLRKHFTDRQTAQIVHVICMGNALDRFTETLGL